MSAVKFLLSLFHPLEIVKRFTLWGDGGGGGGGGSQVQTQTTISDLPEWSKGYAQDVLAKGAALTDVNKNPYQTYGGQRIAGFTPLQQQAFQGAANLGPTAQTAMGSGLAAAAGAGGLGTQYQAGRFSGGQFSPMAAGQYMSPFVQQALEPQLREATRQSAIMGQQTRAQAAQQGAFGGSRQGLMEAERQRNLGTQLSDITGKGYQTAYEQAANQFNQDMARRMQAQQLGEQSRQFGANLGLQGLQTGLQAAGTLGNLGAQQFAQQQGAIQAQTAAGATQQAQEQKTLDTAYQDFLTQKNYPYQQLSYMSNLIRGIPMGMNTQSQVYQPAPTTAQTIGALGLGAYGLSKMMASGGSVKGYAGDEGSVTDSGLGIIDKFNDERKMLSGMHGLSDDELQQIVENPTTPAEAAAARQEINRRQEALIASERNGMAGAYNQLPYSQQQRMVRAAGGGILAFAGDEEDNDPASGQMISDLAPSPGNPRLQGLYGDKMLEVIKRMESAPGYTPMSRAQTRAAELAEYQDLTKFAGEDPYAPMRKRLEEDEAARGKTLEQGKGLAALQAASAILQPGGTIRGLGAAGAAFGGAYGQALQADRAEKRYLGQMQFNLADAQRKERLGLTKEARASVQASEVAKLNAYKAGIQRDQAIGNMLGRGMQATRPVGGGGGAGKTPKLAEQLAAAEMAHENNPTEQTLKNVTALRRAMAQSKTSDVGKTKADLTREGQISQEDTKVQAAMNSFKYTPEYMEARQAGPEEADRVWNAELERQRGIYRRSGATPGSGEQKTPTAGPSRIKFDAQGNRIPS